MIVRQKRTAERPSLPWLPPGDYSEIDVVRNRRGLGDLLQIMTACERLQEVTKTPVRLLGPNGLIEICKNSLCRTKAIPDARKPRKTVFEASRSRAKVYLDFPCPSEGNEVEGNRIDRLTLFHKALGVTPHNPTLRLTASEQNWGLDWCVKKTGTEKPIVLVYKSSERWKDYQKPEVLFNLIESRLGPVVMLENQDRLHSKPNTYGLSLIENAAIINQAKIVITPDTGWLHVAGLLGKPIFGLFGAQDPSFRQTIYNVPGSYHQGACPYGKLPCWYDVCRGRDEIQPCMKTDPNTLVDQIETTLERIAKTWYFFHLPKTGGGTVHDTLRHYNNILYWGDNPHTFNPEICGHNKVFSFIRHPVERAVSAYLWIKGTDDDHDWIHYLRNVEPNTFFEDEKVLRAIATKSTDSMLLSQTVRLRTVTDHTRDISILRMEDGIEAGLNKIGITESIQVKHHVCKEPKFTLTQKSKEVIERVYADDLRLWNECENSTKLPNWI